MCLLFYCQDAHEYYPFVLLANRDEFYERPTRTAGYWSDHPAVLAGRDLRREGTWLGITRSGRWAALTNFREPSDARFERSRGDIVRDYLTGDTSPADFAAALATIATEYDGFNLLFGDRNGALWISNRDGAPRALGPGIYGLSNHLLETPWPKVVNGKRVLQAQLQHDPVKDRLFAPLGDTTVYEDGLPDTGVDPEVERMLSSAFIANSRYGTRSSTLIMVNRDRRVHFEERTYDKPADGTADPSDYSSKIFNFGL